MMRPARQLVSNDRSHALIKAGRRDSLRLVPEVAMAASAQSLPARGVGYRSAAPAADRLGCINHQDTLL